jgi:hypothetical protein
MRSITSALLLAVPALALPASEIFERQGTCSTASSYAAVNEKQLPDPWKFADGKAVATAADWTCRQAEMSKMMQQYELGDMPGPPDSLTASLSGTTMTLNIKVGSNSKTVTVTFSKGSSGAAIIGVGGISIPVPGTVGKINFGNDACAAQSNPNSHGTGWFFDLHGKSHSAGATTAWAWCVSQLITGLEQLGAEKTGIDPKKLGVTGCSRNGKGAFVVGALNPR